MDDAGEAVVLHDQKRLILVLLLGPILTGCRSSGPLSDATPKAQYRAAIDDARTAAPSEIVTTLTPIVPHNDDLVGRTTADSVRQVLVVT